MKTLTGKCSENEVHRTTVYRKLYAKSMKDIWVKVFKNGPSKFGGRRPLKTLKNSKLKAVFQKFYLVHF